MFWHHLLYVLNGQWVWRCVQTICPCSKWTQEHEEAIPAIGGRTSTLILCSTSCRTCSISLGFLLVSVSIWLALRRQSSFRISTTLSSVFIWTCLPSKSVSLTKTGQYAMVYFGFTFILAVQIPCQERCHECCAGGPAAVSDKVVLQGCVLYGWCWCYALCSAPRPWFRGLTAWKHPSSPASHETKARDRLDNLFPQVSAVGDWVVCGRRRLFSDDVGLL